MSISFSIPTNLAIVGSLNLSGLLLVASGVRLDIGSDFALMGQDSGNFIAFTTGVSGALVSRISSVSGAEVLTGNARSYTGAVATGLNFLAVSFGTPFPGIPAVVASIQITGNIMYGVNISGVTTSGYNALFSATTTENLILNTNAFYRA